MKRLYVFIAIIFLCAGCKPLDNQLKRRGQNAVEASLKDPDSAKFRNVHFVEIKMNGLGRYQKAGYVCGEVNAKNGFGAYGGFQKFAVTVEAKTLYLIPFFGVEHQESPPKYVDSYEYRDGAEAIDKICSSY